MCQPGQAVKEGQYIVSRDITTPDQAKVDSVNRCRLDRSLAKIVYVGTAPDGKRYALFTYENPDLKPEPSEKSSNRGAGATRGRKSGRKPKPTLLRKVRAIFEED